MVRCRRCYLLSCRLCNHCNGRESFTGTQQDRKGTMVVRQCSHSLKGQQQPVDEAARAQSTSGSVFNIQMSLKARDASISCCSHTVVKTARCFLYSVNFSTPRMRFVLFALLSFATFVHSRPKKPDIQLYGGILAQTEAR